MTTARSTKLNCPQCRNKGKRVMPLTLRALLRDEFVGEVAYVEYKFCESRDCDVVYHRDGQFFTKDQLKTPVGVKESSGQRPLCYCFGHSIATIKQELKTTRQSTALNDIRQKMQDPGCRCETENPSGACCLGSVAKGIETAKAELDHAANTPRTTRGETVTKIGTVLSAVMASSCCWLPLLLLAFGVSGAGIAGALESYRPVFFTLTFGFLAAAFYLTYRRRKPAASGDACAADCCADGKTLRRLNMMTLNKAMLWVVTVSAVLFLFFPNYVGVLLSVAGAKQSDAGALATDAHTTTSTFAIEGMHCEACSAIVEQSVGKLPGVLSVTVDYDNKRAVVVSDGHRSPSAKSINDAIEAVGFEGREIRDAQDVRVENPK